MSFVWITAELSPLSLSLHLQPDSFARIKTSSRSSDLDGVWALPFKWDFFFWCDIKSQDTPKPALLRSGRIQNMIFRPFPNRGKMQKQSTISLLKVRSMGQQHRGHRESVTNPESQDPPQTYCFRAWIWTRCPGDVAVHPGLWCTGPCFTALVPASPGDSVYLPWCQGLWSEFKLNISLHSQYYKGQLHLAEHKFFSPPMHACICTYAHTHIHEHASYNQACQSPSLVSLTWKVFSSEAQAFLSWRAFQMSRWDPGIHS